MTDPNEYAQTIVDALETMDDVMMWEQCNEMGHVGWLGKQVDDGTLEGVTFLQVQRGDSIACVVTVETYPRQNRPHSNLGFAVVKPGRTGSTLWRIAEGYVNGYPLRDILWFTLTRCWFPKLMHIGHSSWRP